MEIRSLIRWFLETGFIRGVLCLFICQFLAIVFFNVKFYSVSRKHGYSFFEAIDKKNYQGQQFEVIRLEIKRYIRYGFIVMFAYLIISAFVVGGYLLLK